jgi:ABC-type amino acid transport substrate-binding protein
LSKYGRDDGFLGGEPLAAVVALGNEDFNDEVDAVLDDLYEDGTWLAIYDRYFSEEPWTLDQMRAEPPAER